MIGVNSIVVGVRAGRFVVIGVRTVAAGTPAAVAGYDVLEITADGRLVRDGDTMAAAVLFLPADCVRAE